MAMSAPRYSSYGFSVRLTILSTLFYNICGLPCMDSNHALNSVITTVALGINVAFTVLQGLTISDSEKNLLPLRLFNIRQL
jgi:hypothetical protein